LRLIGNGKRYSHAMFWRYLKLQLFILICGGVGPAFLIFYFVLGQPSDAAWMLYCGVGITVLDFLIPPALIIYGSKSAARRAAFEQSGVLALAEITGITETGTRINEQPLVTLQLHVSGSGFTPFDSEDRVIASVTRLGNITARKLVVFVDPATQKYQIDWERSALVNGLVPAQFTVAEDNKTYDLSGQAGPLMEILQILKANNTPLNQMVDIRSNPVLREQIQAVVRRAAAQPATAPAAAGASPEKPSIGERLQELETLRHSGALTDEEYTSKRAQIIADI
jgi:hypothetical protein